MEDATLQSFPPVFESLIFQLFPRVMSSMNGEVGAVLTIMVACLALEAIIKYQVEHLNKVKVPATAIGIDEEVEKKRKVRDCV